MDLPTLSELEAAAHVVYAAIPPTPQYAWPLLSARCSARVIVKPENHTPVGAFKVRGGLVYFEWLARAHPEVRGVVTATRGNHGQSVGFAARRHGLRAVVVVPRGNAPRRTPPCARSGLSSSSTERTSRMQPSTRGSSPPPWPCRSCHRSMRCSSEGWARTRWSWFGRLPIWSGSTFRSASARESAACWRHGRRSGERWTSWASRPRGPPLTHAASRAGGRNRTPSRRRSPTAAVRTPDPEALALIRHGVAGVVEVTDAEIEAAMAALFTDTRNVAEGAGAAGLAALLREGEANRGRTVGFVCTGANVDATRFADVLSQVRGRHLG